ncbi:MAG: hypothetical protein V4510_03115 [bacterium]
MADAAGGQRGRRVILGLFVVLAVCTALALWLFSRTTEGSLYRASIWRALAGDLAIPVVAWCILEGLAVAGRPRWLWWLASIPAAAATYGVVTLVIRALDR